MNVKAGLTELRHRTSKAIALIWASAGHIQIPCKALTLAALRWPRGPRRNGAQAS